MISQWFCKRQFKYSMWFTDIFSPACAAAGQCGVHAEPQSGHGGGLPLDQQQLVRRRHLVARHRLLPQEAVHLRGLGGAHAKGEIPQPERHTVKNAKKITLSKSNIYYRAFWWELQVSVCCVMSFRPMIYNSMRNACTERGIYSMLRWNWFRMRDDEI